MKYKVVKEELIAWLRHIFRGDNGREAGGGGEARCSAVFLSAVKLKYISSTRNKHSQCVSGEIKKKKKRYHTKNKKKSLANFSHCHDTIMYSSTMGLLLR